MKIAQLIPGERISKDKASLVEVEMLEDIKPYNIKNWERVNDKIYDMDLVKDDREIYIF